ncbi:MAG TPA: RNA polymerase sigma factor [Stackebrandtia sp.]|jgi:RNA polymerase sigma-70 factor (ECF subfamily)|uniref:RNA polymerase sigma factor n=1 Tax=Stackebrandtia sp. TaxID=2023065 RepID=UPI002D26DF6E|nr:RNA polymerase sigma factor [Stackebrandtia sp.]HZE38693.1 RNA polymerase sigma factor [Stackebrandtia sp.]
MVDTPGADISAIARDPAAFEDFYRTHVDDVLRFITRRVDDPHLAADLTADVFLAAIESARGYQSSRGEPRSWLYGVARNVVAYERRRLARRRKATRRVEGRALLNDTDITELTERIDAEARSRQLYLAMGRLSDKDRAVLELVALEGLSLADAAAALGIKAGTARVRLHRARKSMKDMIDSPRPGTVTTSSEVLT